MCPSHCWLNFSQIRKYRPRFTCGTFPKMWIFRMSTSSTGKGFKRQMTIHVEIYWFQFGFQLLPWINWWVRWWYFIKVYMWITNICKSFFLRKYPPGVHPLLQENYTGVETARLWNYLFLSFLGKTKREQPLLSHVYCEIWPHSLQFLFWNFDFFW